MPGVSSCFLHVLLIYSNVKTQCQFNMIFLSGNKGPTKLRDKTRGATWLHMDRWHTTRVCGSHLHCLTLIQPPYNPINMKSSYCYKNFLTAASSFLAKIQSGDPFWSSIGGFFINLAASMTMCE